MRGGAELMARQQTVVPPPVDALLSRLACFRAGELTSVWVPDAAHEALRDLVRARKRRSKTSYVLAIDAGDICCDTARDRRRHCGHGRRSTWTGLRRGVSFDQRAQQLTLEDYLAEVDHVGLRIARLD
jgi:hypothetical protein